MLVKLKAAILYVIHKVPYLLNITNALRRTGRSCILQFKSYRNTHSLLSELDSEAGLQIPLLVEQNRRLFREVERLKSDIEMLKKKMDVRDPN